MPALWPAWWVLAAVASATCGWVLQTACHRSEAIGWWVCRAGGGDPPGLAAAGWKKGGAGIAVRGRMEKFGRIDFLKAARDFADCMLRWGRDRYGREHTPLFAALLTREKEPRIGPEPYFARPSPYRIPEQEKRRTDFYRYDFNKCLNYPPGLGSEGPHKVTLCGCDVYEDEALYAMLVDLSRVTGEPRYRAEAEKALRWWFTHTMGPAGLYPWGEHMGWDFRLECPTYFAGPSRHLYHACYHEIKDRVAFVDFLAGLPAPKPGGLTYLERYALGVWNAHYWDKERAVYCRHGDYTGRDDRRGSYGGFPAHQGAHLRLWVAAYLHGANPGVRAKMAEILNKVLDVQLSRVRRFGFVPFTFEADYAGKPARKSAQSIRLAHHAAELAIKMRQANPAIAAKLEELARVHLGDHGLRAAVGNIKKWLATGDKAYIQLTRPDDARPTPEVADLAAADTPRRHATEILRRLMWYRLYRDRAYLEAAREQARLAYARFMDEGCPLPRAFASGPKRTLAGEPFPDFYFRGARLMRAFALLGEALSDGGPQR